MIVGYILAIIVGISLGLTGAGGSILTLPILVYVMKIDAVTATGYSLFIVGATSLVGTTRSFIHHQVNLRMGMLFGLPSILTAIAVRTFLIPILPDVFFRVRSFALTKNIFLLLLFAVVMIGASVNMIKPQKLHTEKWPSLFSLIVTGILVGTLTGLVGAGGGFLIIPALVLFLKLPMKKAVGTSLFIITLNTLCSFIGGLVHTQVNWGVLLIFTAVSIVGIFIGFRFSNKIPGARLKPIFGWFILLMGVFIILKELLFTNN
jgi:uncharacterized membrane protein YfcA